MPKAKASATVPGPISAAEALWYDVEAWPLFVDGFERLVSRDGDWPREGAVTWDSRPNGRGRVTERVTRWSPREGQTAQIEDPSLLGTQTVAFASKGEDAVEVTVTLEYGLKKGGPLMFLTDTLFIRRALRDSLRRTVERYAARRRVAPGSAE